MVTGRPNGDYTTIQPVFRELKEQDFYSDRSQNGEPMNSEKEDLFAYMGPAEQLIRQSKSVTLNAYLLHTDRYYYEYHRSVIRSTRAQDNPFAEPVLVYSNIQDGLGVFAAFDRQTVEVRIK